MKYSLFFAAAAAINGANAAVGMWGQCGGINYSGETNCVSGAFCSTLNSWYAQCLSGAGQATTTTPARTTTTSVRVTTTTTSAVRTTTTTSAVIRTTTTTPRSTTNPGSTVRTTTTTAPVVTTTPRVTTTGGTGGQPGAAVTLSGNPFEGRQQYPNPYYSSEVYSIAIPSMIAAGKASLTAAAKAVATVPNFIWFDTISKVPSLDGYLADIRAKNAAGASPPIIGTFVVYDLPDRDCAAKASNGELAIAKDGLNRYKTEYIDALVATFKKYPDVPVGLIIEPDSVANMVTNMGVAKCAGAKATYEEAITYAVKSLNMPNIAMYMDAGHAGWLGWPENVAKAGPYYAGLYKAAGSPSSLRGLATNVANYNAWSITGSCPSYTADFFRLTGYCDEKGYINALSPLLRANGFPAHFVVDQGRSGKQPTGQIAWGDWCNIKGTGFGIRPDTPSPDPLLDAFVWIKPGGEGDGTSDQSASRYDSTCGLEAAFKPAPEAGTWFQGYFEQLLVNSNPKF